MKGRTVEESVSRRESVISGQLGVVFLFFSIIPFLRMNIKRGVNCPTVLVQ